jgi:hypothetical protein
MRDEEKRGKVREVEKRKKGGRGFLSERDGRLTKRNLQSAHSPFSP